MVDFKVKKGIVKEKIKGQDSEEENVSCCHAYLKSMFKDNNKK